MMDTSAEFLSNMIPAILRLVMKHFVAFIWFVMADAASCMHMSVWHVLVGTLLQCSAHSLMVRFWQQAQPYKLKLK